jgi:hypothetical protein
MAFANTHLASKEVTDCSTTSKIIVNINLGDVTNLSDAELSKRVDDLFMVQLSEANDKLAVKELECTVTLSAEVTVAAVKTTVSVTVTGPCSEVMDKAASLLKEAKRKVASTIIG